MDKPTDLKIRQLIFTEWKAKTSASAAVTNIRKKLTEGKINGFKVSYWYKRFDSGDTSIFAKSSKFHGNTGQDSLNGGSTRVVNSVLFSSNAPRFNSRMLTNDGRLALFSPGYARYAIKDFTILDLFNGTKRKMAFDGMWTHDSSAEMVDDDYMLITRTDLLCLCKIDYKNWKINLVASAQIRASKFVIDELDRRRFLVILEGTFMTGRIDNDQLILDEPKTMNLLFNFWHSSYKLEGKKLSAIGRTNSQESQPDQWKFYEVDLESQRQEVTDLIMTYNDGRQLYIGYSVCFFWWENRCFLAYDVNTNPDSRFNPNNYKVQVMAFDSESRTWSDTGVSVKGHDAGALFVDWDGVLTMQVHTSGAAVFYRFPLMKPDSLQNLSFMTMLNSSKIYGSKLFEKVAHRLPYTCDLRNQVPDESKGGQSVDEDDNEEQSDELMDGDTTKEQLASDEESEP